VSSPLGAGGVVLGLGLLGDGMDELVPVACALVVDVAVVEIGPTEHPATSTAQTATVKPTTVNDLAPLMDHSCQ
jgi:hypothetical protein